MSGQTHPMIPCPIDYGDVFSGIDRAVADPELQATIRAAIERKMDQPDLLSGLFITERKIS